MSLVKRIGLGFTLGVDKTGGSSYTVLGNIVDGWKGPGAKAEKVDTSVLADLFKTIKKGQIDPGELTFTVAYDPLDANTKLLGDCLALTAGSTIPTWQVTGAGTYSTKTFSAELVGLSEEVSRGKLNTCDVTLAISGDPGYAHN